MLCYLWFWLCFLRIAETAPHIVFVMIDDVGWADFSYNNPLKTIPTPKIDELSSQGVRFTKHYSHTTCTPSRASLMTGKYHSNVGLVMAMLPGSPVGIPDGVPTLPQILRKHGGYSAHMVGKWHLGHSKWSQTPVGKGFQSHVGCFMWDIDSYTKQMFLRPWDRSHVDWVRCYENRTYTHFLDPRHATVAITEESEAVMKQHSQQSPDSPLFLYVAYTAAHSPLQPEPEHAAKCTHIPHLWRREYCGMVVGLDEGIHNLSLAINKYLGEDTILVVASDNGGSTWFGGLNYPLRSGKLNPYEGGVRVPAFAVDFTGDRRYLGRGNRTYDGLMHFSDWLPTLSHIAGLQQTEEFKSMDGVNMAIAIRNDELSPRNSVLLELYTGADHFDNQSMSSFIDGKYKLIEGVSRDPHWYYESTIDRLNSTDTSPFGVRALGEPLLRLLEWHYGSGRFDTSRIALTHAFLQNFYLKRSKTALELYDLEKDPYETVNIASQFPEVVDRIREKIEQIRKARPAQQRFWMQVSPDLMGTTLIPGDCQGLVPQEDCQFAHPWLDDNVSVSNLNLTHGIDFAEMEERKFFLFVSARVGTCLTLVIGSISFSRYRNKKRKKIVQNHDNHNNDKNDQREKQDKKDKKDKGSRAENSYFEKH